MNGGGIAIGTGIKIRKLEKIIYNLYKNTALDEDEKQILDKIILKIEGGKS